MGEPLLAERRVLTRQSSFSTRLLDNGDHRWGYIEHSSSRYLVARGRSISCEPLKRDDKDFEHCLATYTAIDDEEAIFMARTFSRQDQSEPGPRIYLWAKKDNTISLQEVDVPDSLKEIPDDEEPAFFRIHGLPSGFVCFESTEYEKHFLAVDEDRVCLKPLPDNNSAPSETPMVQFKINYIHVERRWAVSLELVGPGNYHQSYIEHCSERYLVVRDYQISCEPLMKDVDNFKYRLATYPALYEKESMVIAQTVSCQHQSERGLRVYLCAKDENSILFQEMDLPDSPQPMSSDDLIFFIRHGLQSGFVCFESSKYPMRFLAVDEDRVCLKQLNDYSAAYETRMVQFKINFIRSSNAI